jgi:ABC-type sugar transport system ATPase subunit
MNNQEYPTVSRQNSPSSKGPGEAMIEVRNLSKKFGNFTAVDNISFEVYKGEIFGFLGANGAGKTTAMNMLLGSPCLLQEKLL